MGVSGGELGEEGFIQQFWCSDVSGLVPTFLTYNLIYNRIHIAVPNESMTSNQSGRQFSYEVG